MSTWDTQTWEDGSSSGGGTDHALLTNLVWTVSAHTGSTQTVAAFDPKTGEAIELDYANVGGVFADALIQAGSTGYLDPDFLDPLQASVYRVIIDAQEQSNALDALGALTPAADRLPYFNGGSSATLATFTAFGRSLVDDANDVAGRATLGVVWIPSRLDFTTLSSSGAGWTNQPSALTEAFGLTNGRRTYDASNAGYFILRARTVSAGGGAAGAYLALQFSTDSGSTWKWADDGSSGASGACSAHAGVSIASGSTSSASAKTALTAAAKALVLWRVVGDGGDGAADPNLSAIAVDFYVE